MATNLNTTQLLSFKEFTAQKKNFNLTKCTTEWQMLMRCEEEAEFHRVEDLGLWLESPSSVEELGDFH